MSALNKGFERRRVAMIEVLERRGSSKDIWNVLDADKSVSQVFFHFSDRVSVYDRGEIPVTFPGLGRLRCAIAGKLFQSLNGSGFLTHYISHDVASCRMYVQPLNIKPLKVDYGHLAVGELLPVELLCRLALTKKFMARIEDRKVSRKAVERLMVFPEFRDGARLRPGFVECSTKFELSDRYLSDTEATEIINCHKSWLTNTCYKSVEEVFEHLYVFFKFSNLLLMDGKLEGGIDHNGDFIIGDSISPDELRLIGPDGRSYDKDPVREWYEKTYPSWKKALDVAKKQFPDDKNKWPPYPGVPPVSVIKDMIARYQSVAEDIAAI